MDRLEAEVGSVREEKRRRKKITTRESLRRKKIQVCQKVGKSRNTVLVQWFVAPEGRKVGLLKRRVGSPLGRWEMKNCTPLWREAHLQVKKLKAPHIRSTFGSWDVEKVHALVARSKFRSQNVQSRPCSDHFWKLRCRKNARRCGPKQISKPKCAKHTMLAPLLEVEMSKKCMPLWREAHFEVKMHKAHQCRTTFGSWDVETVHAVVARSKFPSQNVQSTPCSNHFWKLRCRKSARRCGAKHMSKSKCTEHTRFGPLLDGTFEEDLLKCIFRGRRSTRDMFIRAVGRSGRWFPERGCILEHQIFRFAEMILRDRCSTSYDLPYTTLRYATLHYTTLRYATLHYTTLHTQHYTTLHYTTPHRTAPHHTTLHHDTLHYIQLHYTTLPYITLHCITYTHYTTTNATATTLHNYITPQVQLNYTTTTTTAALHHTTSSSCGWGDRPGDHCNHCNHSKKHSPRHLSVHQWIRSAIRDSQQPTSPIGFLFFETSATALCGTTGIYLFIYLLIYLFNLSM